MVEALCHADTSSRSYSGRCDIPRCPTGVWLGIVFLPTMVWCIQSELRALTKTFYKVEALVDANSNVLNDQHGKPKVKVPNPIIELPYSYLVAWNVMHCPSLMTAAYTSKDFMSFLQKLERSTWQHAYIFYIMRAIQSDLNYQLV